MYLRAVHAELDHETLRQFIRDNPLGILITGLQSSNFPFLQCTHIPWVLDADHVSEHSLGRLRGHLARANPHAKALIEAVQERNGSLEQEVTVLFNGPAHSYVTPKFYVQTKPATGKVVPTWNYSAAQVYGKATIFCDTRDADTSSYLQDQIEALTKQSEETYDEATVQNGKLWEVNDAPCPFIDLLKKAIIGVEIEIERLEGKYKMSQELGQGDRDGVVEGFEAMKTEPGFIMARTVQDRAALKAVTSTEK